MGFGTRYDVLNPTEIPFFETYKINDVLAGQDHTYVFTEENVYSFGYNEYGQLGIGNKNLHALPVEFKELNGIVVKRKEKTKFSKSLFSNLHQLNDIEFVIGSR